MSDIERPIALDARTLNIGVGLAIDADRRQIDSITADLARRFPRMDAESLDAADELCRAIVVEGLEAAPRCWNDADGDKQAAFTAFARELVAAYDWVSPRNLARLFKHCCTSAWYAGELIMSFAE